LGLTDEVPNAQPRPDFILMLLEFVQELEGFVGWGSMDTAAPTRARASALRKRFCIENARV
jgi:hypothetical protein